MYVFEAATGKELRVLPGDDVHLTSVSWAPNSRAIATSGLSGFITIWRIDDGIMVKRLACSGGIGGMDWSAAGSGLLALDKGGQIHLWNDEQLLPRRFAYQHGEADVTPQFYWNGDSQSLRISHAGLTVWEQSKGEAQQLKPSAPLTFAGPNGATLVRTDHPIVANHLELVSAKTRKVIGTLDKHETGGQVPQTIRWSPDGKLVAGSVGDKPYCCVCDTVTGKLLCTVGPSVRTDSQDVWSIDFSPDASRIAVGILGAMVIAEMPHGRILFEDKSIFARDICWSANGKLLVIRSGDDLQVLDDSGRVLRKMAGAGRNTRAPALSPDGELVAVLTSKLGVPQLYDVATGRQILSFHGTEGGLSMSWSPDGSILAIACKDGYVDLVQAPPAPTNVAEDGNSGQSPGR